MRSIWLLVPPALLCTACPGLTFGENQPGDDTWMEGGSIAVDPRTETAFVLQTERKTGSGAVVRKTLFAAHPDSPSARTVARLDRWEDIRLLFPPDAVLLMAEENGVDRLTLLDPADFSVRAEASTRARYHGTRLSPSGRYLGVADNNDARLPIHLIDTATLAATPIPHDGEWLEMVWLHGSDTLVAIVFYDQAGPAPYARLLAWSFEDASPLLRPVEEAVWAGAILDVRVEGALIDLGFSHTWVGISPDDGRAVFPVRTETGFRLLILDLATGEVRTHDEARGPVGFSPDSTTIVAFRIDEAGEDLASELVLIDAVTLAEEVLALPYESGPQYFITREGNLVVVAPSLLEDGSLILYDFDRRQMGTVTGPSVHLSEFVSRPGEPELWLVDGGLYRLDLEAQTVSSIPIDWVPEHVNVLPERDALVLDDPASASLVFLALERLEVIRRVPIP